MLLKQVSEQHFGTSNGDKVTGAPVIELGYTHLLPYLIRLRWQHRNKLGWHHDRYNLVPKTKRSWGWDFFVVLKNKGVIIWGLKA